NVTVSNSRITSNGGDGIFIQGLGNRGSSANVNITGNLVGTDGLTAMGNSGAGIHIADYMGVSIGSASDSTGKSRNIIISNEGHGISVERSRDVTIEGNYIGVDQSGLAAIGNRGDGISVIQSHGIEVEGGTNGSIIATNGGNGVTVENSESTLLDS